jgi:putative chitinase
MKNPLTIDVLERFAPHANEGYKVALANGWQLLQAAKIDTELRVAHFISQFAGHETGGMTIVRENTRWTPEQVKSFTGKRFANLQPRVLLARGDAEALANIVYATTNGNEDDGDGWLYRGGGFNQLTGRANYRACGDAIGVDLEGEPKWIEHGEIALKAAIWEWTECGLNKFADHNYGRAIGNAINRGNPFSKYDPIGYESRQRWFAHAWSLVGGGQPLPVNTAMYLGAFGADVRHVQGQLRELGYAVGDVDDVYGPTMARAVAGFKLDHKRGVGVELEPDEAIGPLTLAALKTAQPVRLSPERENATIADLKAKGSTEVVAGAHMEAVGRGLATAGALGGAGKIGLLDSLLGPLQQLTALRGAAAGSVAAIAWGLENFWPLLCIAGGVYCWRSGYHVQLARLIAHQLGFNLSR